MWLFKKKHNEREAKQIFDFFKFEKTESGALLLGDFADKDFCHWLTFVHWQIQAILKSKLLDGNKIDNYVQFTLHIGGQRVDIAIIKDGCKSPHELLQEYKQKEKKGE